MPVIAVITAEETVPTEDDLAPTRSSTPGPDGGHVPGRLAGYTYDGAAYCPACAEDVEVETAEGETYTLDHFPAFDDDGNRVHDGSGFGVGIVSGTDEWDYPGASCHVCHRRLQTNVLVYDEGGAHPTPVVEVWGPDGDDRTAEAFVMEKEEEHVRVMLAENFYSYGDPGKTSWIPREDVVDRLD